MDAGIMSRKVLGALALLCLSGCLPLDREAQRGNEWIVVSPRPPMGAQAGVTATSANPNAANTTMYRDVQFADIPVPSAYSILTNQSYSFQGALFRNGILKYQGPVEYAFAINFFRGQLPARGWKLEKTERGSDSRIMYFSKGQEKLIVIVSPVSGGSRTELQLDNIDNNDLLLKGKLTDPGYGQPPTYTF